MTLQTEENPYSTSSDILTPVGVMSYLNISRSTLWRFEKYEGLPCMRLNRLKRYRRGDVDAWLETREQRSGEAQA